MTVKTLPENPLRTGDNTRLAFPAKHCHLFDPTGLSLPRA